MGFLKRIVLPLVLMMLTSLCWSKKTQVVHGYFIKKGDTTKISLSIRYKQKVFRIGSFQNGVHYKNEKGEKVHITVDDADRLYFELKGVDYRYVRINVGSRMIFAQEVVTGDINLYQYTYSVDVSPPGGYYSTSEKIASILIDKYARRTEVKRTRFKKQMRGVFSHCSELVRLIERGTYHREDIKEIVVYHNSHCTVP